MRFPLTYYLPEVTTKEFQLQHIRWAWEVIVGNPEKFPSAVPVASSLPSVPTYREWYMPILTFCSWSMPRASVLAKPKEVSVGNMRWTRCGACPHGTKSVMEGRKDGYDELSASLATSGPAHLPEQSPYQARKICWSDRAESYMPMVPSPSVRELWRFSSPVLGLPAQAHLLGTPRRLERLVISPLLVPPSTSS